MAKKGKRFKNAQSLQRNARRIMDPVTMTAGIAIASGGLGVLFALIGGLQSASNKALEKKKLEQEVKSALIVTMQQSNVGNPMKCLITFEQLATVRGNIPLDNNPILDAMKIARDQLALLDLDKNGVIDMREWVAFWVEMERASSECHVCSFKRYDTCFLCVNNFCVQHFEVVSDKHICLACHKKVANLPEVIRKKEKLLRRYEMENQRVAAAASIPPPSTEWNPSYSVEFKCCYKDCNSFSSVACCECCSNYCAYHASARVRGPGFHCWNCFKNDKKKKKIPCSVFMCPSPTVATCNGKCKLLYKVCEDHSKKSYVEMEGYWTQWGPHSLGVNVLVCTFCIKKKTKKTRLDLKSLLDTATKATHAIKICVKCKKSILPSDTRWDCGKCSLLTSFDLCEDCVKEASPELFNHKPSHHLRQCKGDAVL